MYLRLRDHDQKELQRRYTTTKKGKGRTKGKFKTRLSTQEKIKVRKELQCAGLTPRQIKSILHETGPIDELELFFMLEAKDHPTLWEVRAALHSCEMYGLIEIKNKVW